MSEILSIVFAALSAVAAVGSFLAARASNRTAQRLTQIEADRRHEELMPRFEVQAFANEASQVRLTVKLVGPSALDWLDEFRVVVRDDTTDHSSPLVGGPTPIEVDAQVWSPFRFVPRIDGATADGRSTGVFRILLGDDRQFLLEPTPVPRWSTPDAWKAMYQGSPLRLTILGRRGTNAVWSVPVEPEIHWAIQIF